jgi:hypothetical protein
MIKCCETCYYKIDGHKNPCLKTGHPNAIDINKLMDGAVGKCKDWKSNILNDIGDKIPKTHINIGSGIEGWIKDTPDGYGVEILIGGSFRHDGLTHQEIKAYLDKCFRELDLDSYSYPEDDA